MLGGFIGFLVGVCMDWMLIGISALLIMFAGLILWVVKLAEKRKPNQKMAEAAEKWQEKQNTLTDYLKENQPKKEADIVEVKYLGGGTVREKKYGMKGVLVGGFFGGVPGAVVGSVLPSGKQKQKQKFAVKYEDGSVRIVECYPNSFTYQNLIKHVKWEEL